MRIIFFTVALVVGIMAVQGQNATNDTTAADASNTAANQTNSGQNDTSSTNPSADNSTNNETSSGNGTNSTDGNSSATNSTQENQESSPNDVSNKADGNNTASNTTESNTNMNETSSANETSPRTDESNNAGNTSENDTSSTINEESNSTLTDDTGGSNESTPTDANDVNNTSTMNMTNPTETSTNDTNVNETNTMNMTNPTETSTNDTYVNETNSNNNMTDETIGMNTTNVNETMTANVTNVQETNTTTNMTEDNGTIPTNMTNSNVTNTVNNTNPTETDSSDDQNRTDSATGCKLPDNLSGVWWSTIWGEVTFTDRHIDAQGDEQLAFECFATDSETGNYILRLLNSSLLPNEEEEVFTCVKFNFRNGDNVHFQILTDRNENLFGKEPLVISVANETVDFEQICTAMGDSVLESDLLRKGREVEGALGCPASLHGTFNVTYTGETASRCPNGASMSSCEVTKTLVYNYTNCNGTEDFAGENRYVCVSGGADHVTTFRNSTEENDFTPFACLSINSTEDGNSTSLDILFSGLGCGDRWSTVSTADSADVAYTLDKNRDCLKSDPDSGSNLTQSILFTTIFALVSWVISHWW